MPREITSPESFFGFRLGSERNIARWDRIVEYFSLLDTQSDSIRLIDLGPSTEGNPFLLAIISAAKNLENLEELRAVNAKLSDPRGVSDSEVAKLVEKGRAIVCQSMSLHANEISATQMAPELAYKLISDTDEETAQILDNTIFLMVPCFNPDGQIMVTDWYNKYLNTEFEGTDLPWLYHKYSGHDNNRDAFMLNLVESQYMAKLMFQEWHPQLFQDHHEMGSYGPRMFLVPYCEPLHPHGDPLIWRELGWYGSHMAYKLEEAGHSGVITGAIFGAWAHMGFHWLGNYHNIASMLTESATARLATPIYIHGHQLGGEGSATLRNMPHYKPQTNFPNPWPGGWWGVRDMIDQQLVSAKAVLHLAARYRKTVLNNAVAKARRQVAKGEEGPISGMMIRPDQHDPSSLATLINKLLLQGIDIYRTIRRVQIDDSVYPPGSFYLPYDQPKRGVIKTLLERTLFSDDSWTRFPDGTPNVPYDTVTDTMAEMMGVNAEPVNVSPEVSSDPARELTPDSGQVDRGFGGDTIEEVTVPIRSTGSVVGNGANGYLLDPRINESYRVVNTLLAGGAVVQRVKDEVPIDGGAIPSGAFLITDTAGQDLESISQESGVSFLDFSDASAGTSPPLSLRRVGMYRRFWGGNVDEGWTRLVLEQYGYQYEPVTDAKTQSGDLRGKYDVIVFPDDSNQMIVGGETEIKQRVQNRPIPEEYRSGIGDKGVENIKAFVEDGGTLITFNGACGFAIENLGLQVRDVTKELSNREFFCPGSTLRLANDISHPFGYGMPSTFLGLCWNSPAFVVQSSHYNHRYQVVASFPERDILQSGWLIGEEHLAGKAAMISIAYGNGRVVLYGLRPQFRAQTHGTYKLLFNALLG